MTINRVQEGLAGFLALDSNDLKQPIQLVLGLRNFFDHPQLLGVQEVEHVIKNRLQVAGVQAHLSQHCVLLFCREERQGDSCQGTALGNGRVKVTVILAPGCPHLRQGEGVKLWHILNNTVGFANIVHNKQDWPNRDQTRICLIGLLMEHDICLDSSDF